MWFGAFLVKMTCWLFILTILGFTLRYAWHLGGLVFEGIALWRAGRIDAPVEAPTPEPSPFRGSGTPDDPYQIHTQAEFVRIRDFPEACFVLTRNIMIQEPIPMLNAFKGRIDGMGFEVEGIRVSCSWIHRNDGVIRNLTVMGSQIAADPNATVTGLIAYNTGELSNVHVREASHHSTNPSTASFVAGLVGANGGKIHQCSFGGEVQALWGQAGGIVGRNFEAGRITSCEVVNISHIGTRNGESVGGICGVNEGVIRNCLARSTVLILNGRHGKASVGGIVGYQSDNGLLIGAANFAGIQIEHPPHKCVGGVIGINHGMVDEVEQGRVLDTRHGGKVESETSGQIIGYQGKAGELHRPNLVGDEWQGIQKRFPNPKVLREVMIGLDQSTEKQDAEEATQC